MYHSYMFMAHHPKCDLEIPWIQHCQMGGVEWRWTWVLVMVVRGKTMNLSPQPHPSPYLWLAPRENFTFLKPMAVLCNWAICCFITGTVFPPELLICIMPTTLRIPKSEMFYWRVKKGSSPPSPTVVLSSLCLENIFYFLIYLLILMNNQIKCLRFD